MRKIKILFLLAIFAVVLVISTYKLTESPRTWYDEGLFIQVARNAAHYNFFGVQIAPHKFDRSIASYATTGYTVTYPIAIVFKIFGVGLLQARTVMIFYILGLVAVSFWLIYRIFGYKKAIFSTLLLVSFAPIYGNGKIVLGEIPGLFFLMSFLLFLNHLEDEGYKNRFVSALVGLLAGLTIITKPIFILLVPVVLIAVLIGRKKINFNASNFAIILVSFLLPLFLFRLAYFGKDSISKVISFYGNNYSASLKDMLGLIVPNIERFFKESTPLYYASVMIIWLGFYILRIRQKKEIKLIENIAFVFCILIAGAYLKTPGWYRYFFPGHVLALLFLPAALFSICEFTNQRFLKNKLPIWLLPAGIGLVVVFQFYQVGFSSWVAGDYPSTRTKELHDYLKNFDSKKTIFLYETAEAATFLKDDNYYQYFRITGDRFLGSPDPLIAGVPDEVIIQSKSLPIGQKYLTKYKVKARLYKGLYYIFEKDTKIKKSR